nr:hypothetical protein [Tanacetum cinerariifolium]
VTGPGVDEVDVPSTLAVVLVAMFKEEKLCNIIVLCSL